MRAVILNYREIEFRPVDFVNFLYLLSNLTLIALFNDRLPGYKYSAIGYSLCLVASLLLIAFAPTRANTYPARIMVVIRDFYPYILTGYYYPALGNMISVLYGTNFDQLLIQAEQAFFASQPSLTFVHAFDNIIIYEAMHFFYFTYYFFAFAIGGLIYRKNKETFHRFMFVLMFMVTLQFYCFVLWPTAGPKFGFAELGGQHLPARGPFSAIMSFMLEGGEIPAGAFPSSHVSVALLCIFFARKTLGFLQVWFFWFLFIGLFISTVYLQQHYAIDSIAGVFVAVFFFSAGNKIYDFALQLNHVPIAVDAT